MLIDKYKKMPEGRSKELLGQLPEVWQEHLTACHDMLTGNITLAMIIDGQEHTLLPADCTLRAAIAELEQILIQEQQHNYEDDVRSAINRMCNPTRY